MRKRNLRKLKIDKAETRKVRSAMAHQKSVKITININAETLAKIRAIANESGVPYQRLINRTLVEGLADKVAGESRLQRIEKELKLLKKKLVA